MRGTALQDASISARAHEGVRDARMTVAEWQTFCEEVRMAAEQLRQIALRAETAAASAATNAHDPMRAIARGIGLTAASTDPKAQTYATMMLGPFAALEELRRRIKP
jgi:hypothetical protein